MPSLADHIKEMENTRAAKVARMDELTKKSIEETRSFDAAEVEEFDELKAEIKQLDEDLVRYNEVLKMQMQTAKPADQTPGYVDKSHTKLLQGKSPIVITRTKDQDEKFEGQNFTRQVIARALSKMNDVPAWAIAEKRWGKSNPTLVEVMKANVAGGGSGAGEWGAELVQADARFAGDFIEFLYAQTVYNKLPLRVVPANVTIKGQDGAATGYWVGESKAIPASAQDFSTVNLTPLKVAAISVVSKELLRDSSPSAEQLVRDALVNACSQRIDTTFVSAAAAVAGSTPAGILNGVTATTSAGTDTDGVINDIKELRNKFIVAKNSGGLWWVMNPSLASSLSLLRNALGQKEFTEMNQEGGMLEGSPVVTGDNVNANHLVLLKPSDIYRIEAGALEVSVSEHATIEQSDAPTGDTDTPTAQSAVPVGMFQTESMAIKAVLPINYAKRRTSAVAYISDADYGGAIS